MLLPWCLQESKTYCFLLALMYKAHLFLLCMLTPHFSFLSGGCSGKRLRLFWAGLQAYEPHLSLTNRINACSGLSVTFSFLFNFLLNTHISEGGVGLCANKQCWVCSTVVFWYFHIYHYPSGQEVFAGQFACSILVPLWKLTTKGISSFLLFTFSFDKLSLLKPKPVRLNFQTHVRF